jgi:hypothetical protein
MLGNPVATIAERFGELREVYAVPKGVSAG